MDDKNKTEAWQPLRGSLLALLLLGILGVAFFFFKNDDVFPAASVDLKLSKSEIAVQAREICRSMGYLTKGSIESTTFQERSDTSENPGAATFLEHEYSMREANSLMHSEICVYFWYTRFCKAYKNEEFQVWLSPDGRLAGINHEIEKELALPSLSQPEAMALALKFIREKARYTLYDRLEPGKQPQLAEGIKLIRQGSIKQVHRLDHYFTWEDQKRDFAGAHIRTSVDISGNQITAYDRNLHIPEEFERKFAGMRSYNDLLKSISSVLFALVAAGTFFVFAWALSTRRLRWKLVLAAALTSFIIALLDYWNSWPSILQSYSTSESLHGYLLSKLASSLLDSGQACLAAIILVGGMDALYRSKFPEKIACEHVLNWKMLSNRTLLESIMAGIFVFGIQLGYVAVYYLAGQKMGVWSPLELRDVGTISSIVPAFSSFAVGVNASVSEELLYRVFCLLLAQRFCKNFWLANLIQAAGWAFMHSDYPQEPACARGIELTVVGFFYGYLFKRFGLLTCIISHFLYDAFLGITPLLFARSATLTISGLLASSPPFLALALGLARRRLNGEDVPDRELQNNKLTAPAQARPDSEELLPGKPFEYKAFSSRMRGALLAICCISLVFCLLLHPRKIGAWSRITVTQPEIEKIALKFLHERGIAEDNWRVGSYLVTNGADNEAQYGFEKLGFKKTEQIIRQARIPMIWWVRFYKLQQKREYDVAVSSQGRPLALKVIDEDDAPGQNISQEDAQKLTADFLKRYRPEFSPLQIDATEEQKHKNRSDFTVSYVVPNLNMGDARFKIDVNTVGGLVSFPHLDWDIPDSWYFERNKLTAKDHVAQVVSLVLSVVLLLLGLIWAAGIFRSTTIPWRSVFIVAGCSASATLISQTNELVSNLAGYDTNVPLFAFLTEMGVKGIIFAIMYAALYAGLFAIAHGAFRLLCPGVDSQALRQSILNSPVQKRSQTRIIWIDGALSAYALVLGSSALSVINDYLEGKFSPDVVVLPLQNLVSSMRYSFPLLEQITDALTTGFVFLFLAPVVVGLYLRYVRTFKRYLFSSFMVVIIIESTAKYWQDYVREVGIGCLEFVLVYFWIKYCARNNAVAYFLAGALSALPAAIYYMFNFSSIHLQELSFICAFFAIPLVIPLFFRQPGEKKQIYN